MIAPKKNNIIRWFFHNYILWIIRRSFHAINFNTIEVDKNRSVLLLANHISWWDGFIMYYLNNKLLGKKFHIMILEETSRKVAFFKYLGAFSIAKNNRDMLASLQYAAELLNDPQNMVLIFPQGKLYSNFINDINFEKGLMKITEQATDKFQFVFAATFIEHLQYKKPTINVYLNSMANQKFKNAEAVNGAYQQHYNSAKLRQTETVV